MKLIYENDYKIIKDHTCRDFWKGIIFGSAVLTCATIVNLACYEAEGAPLFSFIGERRMLGVALGVYLYSGIVGAAIGLRSGLRDPRIEGPLRWENNSRVDDSLDRSRRS